MQLQPLCTSTNPLIWVHMLALPLDAGNCHIILVSILCFMFPVNAEATKEWDLEGLEEDLRLSRTAAANEGWSGDGDTWVVPKINVPFWYTQILGAVI